MADGGEFKFETVKKVIYFGLIIEEKETTAKKVKQEYLNGVQKYEMLRFLKRCKYLWGMNL